MSKAAPQTSEGRPPTNKKGATMEAEELMIERAAFDTDLVDTNEFTDQPDLDGLLYPLEEQYASELEMYEEDLQLEKGEIQNA